METYTPLAEIQKDIRLEIEKVQARYKEQYNENRNTRVQLILGDIVFMKLNPVATGYLTKLQYF